MTKSFKVHFHNRKILKDPIPVNFVALCTRYAVDKITLNEDEVTCQSCLVRMGKMESTRSRNAKAKHMRKAMEAHEEMGKQRIFVGTKE